MKPASKRTSITTHPLRLSGIGGLITSFFLSLIPVIWPPAYLAQIAVIETAAALVFFTSVNVLIRPLDLTDPIHWMNGLLALMFVVHPYLVLSKGALTEPYHGLFYIVPHYSKSCFIGLTASVILNLAYAWTLGRGAKRPISFESSDIFHDPHQWVDTARFCTIAALIGASISSIANGSVLAAFSRSDAVSSAYIYNLPLLFAPAACLWYASGHFAGVPQYKRLGWVIALGVAIVTIAGGQRLGLLTAAGPFFLTIACFKNVHIPRFIVLALIVVSMFGFAFLRDLSGPTAGVSNKDEVLSNFTKSPTSVLLETLDGSDTEMVDAISLELNMVPTHISFSPEQDFMATVGASVPRAFWAAKPLTVDQQLNGTLLGRGVNEASVAYSLFGEAWFAGGWIAVVLFSAATGVVFARVRRSYLGSDRAALQTCLYALVTPLTITHLRGTLAYTLAFCLFYLGPIMFLLRRQQLLTSSTETLSPSLTTAARAR